MRLYLAAMLASAIAAPAGAAVTLNFDDLTGTSLITNYQGFDFSEFYALDTNGFPSSGYDNSVKSLSNVAYNGKGVPATISAATPFNLVSGYLGAAWNDGLTVQVVGTLAGAAVFAQSFVVNTSGATFETFDTALVDKVVFSTSGGVPHGYTAGGGIQLSLDDLTINPGTPAGAVPEPAMWAIMVAGFGLVGTALRRPRRAHTA